MTIRGTAIHVLRSSLRTLTAFGLLTGVACSVTACGGDSGTEEDTPSTSTSLPGKQDDTSVFSIPETSELESASAADITEAFKDQLPNDVAGDPGDPQPVANAREIASESNRADPTPIPLPPATEAPAVEVAPAQNQEEPQAPAPAADPNMPYIPSPVPNR